VTTTQAERSRWAAVEIGEDRLLVIHVMDLREKYRGPYEKGKRRE